VEVEIGFDPDQGGGGGKKKKKKVEKGGKKKKERETNDPKATVNTYRVSPHDQVFLPSGNFYSVRNVSGTEEAVVLLTVRKRGGEHGGVGTRGWGEGRRREERRREERRGEERRREENDL